MLRIVLNRLLWGVATLAGVAMFIFAAVEALPGDACTAYLGRAAQGTRLENCRRDFDLNRPAIERFADWAGGMLQGDLGYSMKRHKPIAEVVLPRLRNTAVLAFAAALAGIPVAIALGVIAGLWRDRPPDVAVSTAAIVAMTLPEFVSATLLILVFSAWLGWSSGIVTANVNAPIADLLPALPMPVIALALIMTAHILRMVRTSVIDVMASEYVQMARLKGMPYWRMVWRYVLPNALLPTINLVALTIAWLLGGVVVIEVVFNYPGIGRLSVDAVSDRDLPTVQCIALIMSAIYIFVNLAADLLSLALNPRLRSARL
jgi:peptide/nickel transport system permease protein